MARELQGHHNKAPLLAVHSDPCLQVALDTCDDKALHQDQQESAEARLQTEGGNQDEDQLDRADASPSHHRSTRAGLPRTVAVDLVAVARVGVVAGTKLLLLLHFPAEPAMHLLPLIRVQGRVRHFRAPMNLYAALGGVAYAACAVDQFHRNQLDNVCCQESEEASSASCLRTGKHE